MPLLHLAEEVEDDRAILRPGELSLLIVEDDIHYAGVLRDMARMAGFRALVAQRGADALRLANDYHPTAITLDIFLPDMLGWTVLARLKQSPDTRHIPVQIVTIEEERHHSMERGAYSYLAKPATTESLQVALERIKQFSMPRVKKLLVVEDDEVASLSIEELIRHDDVEIERVATGEEALSRCAPAPSTAWCWTCACPTWTASSCWTRSRPSPRCTTCRSWCSPART
jgi:DNA-binding response OmpR family regulator